MHSTKCTPSAIPAGLVHPALQNDCIVIHVPSHYTIGSVAYVVARTVKTVVRCSRSRSKGEREGERDECRICERECVGSEGEDGGGEIERGLKDLWETERSVGSEGEDGGRRQERCG